MSAKTEIRAALLDYFEGWLTTTPYQHRDRDRRSPRVGGRPAHERNIVNTLWDRG
jgi:hypothetical protein